MKPPVIQEEKTTMKVEVKTWCVSGPTSLMNRSRTLGTDLGHGTKVQFEAPFLVEMHYL